MFSATLLVEQGWNQLISFLHKPYHPRVNPFTRSEDESVSSVLCVRVLAPTEGLVLTVKFRQPSHEFTFGVGITFVSNPLVLTPVV
jgi:hypothetical protein